MRYCKPLAKNCWFAPACEGRGLLFKLKDKTNCSHIESTTINTLYITDSIIIKEPQYLNKYITHYTTDTLYSVDSILVPVHIPIETAIYSDTTDTYKYKATISGYKPFLDELQVFTTTPQLIPPPSDTSLKNGRYRLELLII